jgi:hypothetical protein
MYPSIALNHSNHKMQQIFWRLCPKHPLKIFKLKRLTFGFGISSYLACRTLQWIGDQMENNERVKDTIHSDFYMDNWITGDDTRESLLELTRNISSLFKSYNLNLTKFTSNSKEIMQSFSKNKLDEAATKFLNMETPENKTKPLGLIWLTSEDHLTFNITPVITEKITKRTLLSQMSSLFDP